MVYPITKLWFYPFCRLLIGRIKCMENIPADMPFIAVSNHELLVDSLLIIYPIIRKLNKKVHLLSSGSWWFLGETICRRWAACVPVFNPAQAYEETKKLIESGEIIGIFPEAGLRKTKNLKTGAIRLALEMNAPILPIGLKSSYIPFNSAINIGKPIYLKKNKKNLKKQMSDLMEEVYRLRNSID